MIDADGQVLGRYRKSHIPDGPGYQEKFYFHPGDSGFKVWQTRYGKLGAAICWDQWFPESARIMALKGRGCALLSDGDRQRAAARAAGGFARSLAPRDAGSCGGELSSRGGRQSHRRGAGSDGRVQLLWFLLRCGPDGRDRRRARTRRRRHHCGAASISPPSPRRAPHGACSATEDPIFTAPS